MKFFKTGIFIAFIMCCGAGAWGQQTVLQGGVYFATKNNPLPGVSVMLVNRNGLVLSGVNTDENGQFRIPHDPDAETITFSMIGFKTQELPLSGTTEFEVFLLEDLAELEGVEVVAEKDPDVDLGFLSIDKSEMSSAVSSIDMEGLDKVPVTSVDQLIQGAAPGLQVVAASGDPGAAASIRIRGVSSISGINDPLWVIDGREVIGSNYKVESITDFGFSPIGDLDPADIESIDILKDASATALYGSRGANGVIVIRTKRGRKGKPQLTFNSKLTMTEVPRTIPMLSGDDQRIYYLEKWTNGQDNGTALPQLRGDLSREDAWIFNNNTDWVDVINRDGFYQQYNTALSGGGDRVSYYWGLGYTNQYGTTLGTGYDRFNTRFNLNYQVSDKLKVSADLSYTNSLTDKRGQDHPVDNENVNPIRLSRETPAYFPVYSRNGLNYFVDQNAAVSSHSRYNPLAIIDYSSYLTKANRFMASTSIDYKILDNLEFRTQVAADFRESADEYFLPGYATDAIPGEDLYNTGRQTDGYQLLINNNNRLTWNPVQEDNHRLTVTGVLNLNIDRNNSTALSYYNGASPELRSADASAVISSATGIFGARKYMGMFIQGHYVFKDRYFLTVTGKTEGDSRYGSDNPYSLFPAIGAGWELSKEPFMESAAWVNSIKPRFTFGITGNLPDVLNLYDVAYSTGIGYMGETYIYPSKFAYDNISEERTTEYNLGIDWALFNNRITGQFDYYNRRTRDLLLRELLSSTLGYSSQYVNFGTVENSGVEFGITAVILEGRDKGFRWKTFFNIARNRNKLLSLPDNFDADAFSSTRDGFSSKLRAGDVIGGFYGYRALGVYSTDADAVLLDPDGNIIYEADGITPKYMRYGSSTGHQFQGGDMIYDDINGDGIINELDQVQIGDANPVFFGGWNNTFNYRNWILSVNFQYQYGNDVINGTRYTMERMQYSHNQSRSILGRWRKQGDIADIPRAQSDGAWNRIASSRWVEDASYLRLKTVSLTYNVEREAISRLNIGLRQLSIFVTAYNLSTWTDYLGLDPEVPITGGVTLYGIDSSTTAPARQFTFGLRASF
ncbi:TonB-linked SusC/RagA family outer membrane protein [Anseongella ginsenosidimutans]|uniref:TonB-linked SusC/RagA family outer membrane protein n=1 Tax=Anseongella ginsenosidimutans TaxID=496056 RepID=A0A4R3KN62_9SPHI|nr:TonB-dependent receptor [Anseongella ginsenosidimutans]QEC52389.1 TonB-dependent receptor [Anseongella ginsenosidimutans]TCS85869.1 TonB-linked SusC/RagA family outer membrane protein [Anseongella ginsenosidimutans]